MDLRLNDFFKQENSLMPVSACTCISMQTQTPISVKADGYFFKKNELITAKALT